MLSELIYVSFRQNTCTDEDIAKILEKSIANNGKQDITGVLLYSKTRFLQVLEGDGKQLLALYDKIKTDERHSRAIMLSAKPIENRYFPDWQMAGKELDSDYKFLQDLSEGEQKQFRQLLDGENQHNAIQIIARLFDVKMAKT